MKTILVTSLNLLHMKTSSIPATKSVSATPSGSLTLSTSRKTRVESTSGFSFFKIGEVARDSCLVSSSSLLFWGRYKIRKNELESTKIVR